MEEVMTKLAFVVLAIIFVFFLAKATAKVASSKGGKAGPWFTAGVLLPGLALVLAILLDEPLTKECPKCIRRVDPTARICGYCGHDFARDDLVPE
jgi:ABC-type amino acid transport system permease subunit